MFSSLQIKWGPCTVDRFASYYNTQLPKFNSRYCNPGAEAIDAFTCDWSSEIKWCCPPVFLIPRVLRHAQNCQCKGILVVPHWPSATSWPLVCPTGESIAPFLCDWCDLPLSEHLLNQAHTGHRPACAWFLKIAFVQMSVCVFVFVSVPKAIKN